MMDNNEMIHSNWRDVILRALQEGTPSTIITFDGCQYRVTFQPHVVPAAPAAPTVLAVGQQAICSQCGRVIAYVGPYWRHVEEPQPKHPAIPVDGSPYA